MTKIVTPKKPKKSRMIVTEPKPHGYDHGMKSEPKRKKVTFT